VDRTVARAFDLIRPTPAGGAGDAAAAGRATARLLQGDPRRSNAHRSGSRDRRCDRRYLGITLQRPHPSEICAIGGISVDDFTSSSVAYRQIFGLVLQEGQQKGRQAEAVALTLRLLEHRCDALL